MYLLFIVSFLNLANTISMALHLSKQVSKFKITRNDSRGISRLKQFLQHRFHTKDSEKLRYYLGIEAVRSQAGINLSQRKYALDLLDETGMLGARPVNVPINPNQKLLKDEKEYLKIPINIIG